MDQAIDMQRRYTRFLQPLSDALFSAAELAPHARALDVGCGTGDTTLDAARRVPEGFAHGVDRDADVIAFATHRARRERLANVSFARADAATTLLDDRGFDHVISRNGTLHFDDPVAAYANLHRTVCPGGQLTFTSFQDPARNAWFSLPLQAVRRVIALPERGPGAPFVFSDPDRIRAVLQHAGWHHTELAAVDLSLWVGADVDDTVAFFEATDGARLRAQLDAATFDRIRAELARALEPHLTPAGVFLGGSAWVVRARCDQ